MSDRPFNPDGVQAYFITIRCYGTWLHGDRRHSMDRRSHNRYGAPPIEPHEGREQFEKDEFRHPAFRFSSATRSVVEGVVREVCRHRGYGLHAVNAQQDHVHIVVTGNARPERMMEAFKSYVTRRLREAGYCREGQKVWSRHGSTKWLWSDEKIERVCAYVSEGQAEPPAGR